LSIDQGELCGHWHARLRHSFIAFPCSGTTASQCNSRPLASTVRSPTWVAIARNQHAGFDLGDGDRESRSLPMADGPPGSCLRAGDCVLVAAKSASNA
jgi:hypothetical protein